MNGGYNMSFLVGGGGLPVLGAVSTEYLSSSGISKGNLLASFGIAIPLTTIVDITVPCAASFMAFSQDSGGSFFDVEELIITVNGSTIPVSGIPSISGINVDVVFKVFGGFLTFSDGATPLSTSVSGVPFRFESLKIELRTSGTGPGNLHSDLELVQ